MNKRLAKQKSANSPKKSIYPCALNKYSIQTKQHNQMDSNSDTITDNDLIKLKSAHQEFIQHLQELNRSTSTILAYGKDIEQLIEFVLQEHQVEHVHDIDPDHLNNFKSQLSGNGYTPKSISRKINSIKTFFRYLKDAKGVDSNPADQVRHPRYETKPPRILSPLEYRALRDAARGDLRTYAIIELLLQTGIRIGELAQLQLKHIQDDQLTIPPYESQPGRTVPLNEASQEAISRYLETRSDTTDEDYLFVTKNNRPLLVRNIRTSINRYFRLGGIEDAKVNDLRHTWIAHHLAGGASLVYISKLAGHKRLSTTEKYLNFIQDQSPTPTQRLKEL